MSNFFSGMAVLASFLALIVSGFNFIQIQSLQQKLNSAIATIKNTATSTNSTTNPNPISNPITSAANNISGVQPGQFVRNSLSNLAQIELLKVNRVPGQTGKVNIQMRIRLKPGTENEAGLITKSIYFSSTTARDPATGETYKAQSDKATPSVNLKLMAIEGQASADAYVWLNVPDSVSVIDIYVPNTEAFTGVPIANN
ncbi:hypothetical protein Sta7437_2991 [Stanieria cyanosphaera PCC 7437]|uniref:DUF4352 domain-containing protein n=1 Tax=Stanieria cyanosphaera (strain ATCC 29371 / PCC 7437) TaxID=111780 RepID=K9XV82_STAC7|nr:hypothetical protein [Stanieria cyanosphaera]AFZ36510.1 hypothetical protein Sta7437_2991 [Stanieria cyanosphaera PCC 7437]